MPQLGRRYKQTNMVAKGLANCETRFRINVETQYLDDVPLLAANTPETREYRMSFWDSGEANGDWTAVAKVMVGA
jgi:hypothetical protein